MKKCTEFYDIIFMYIMKSCGPSIDPCVTPVVISVVSDLLLPNWTYCLRLVNYLGSSEKGLRTKAVPIIP